MDGRGVLGYISISKLRAKIRNTHDDRTAHLSRGENLWGSATCEGIVETGLSRGNPAAGVPPAMMKALWHIEGDLHTLQPIPVHPSERPQDDEETLPNDVTFAPETRVRCDPWNMLPPQAGAEHVAPPKPGGQTQAEELIGTP